MRPLDVFSGLSILPLPMSISQSICANIEGTRLGSRASWKIGVESHPGRLLLLLIDSIRRALYG